MDPQNQEYHEAAQAKANEIRQKFYATLTEHEKAQFDAVEKACNLLVDAGVLFYLFPMLPNASGRQKMLNIILYGSIILLINLFAMTPQGS